MRHLYRYICCLPPLAYSLPQAHVTSTQLVDDTALVALVSSAVASASLKPFVQPQPTDEIKEWSALGDSYTAGIGSDGKRDQQMDSGDCSRYDRAYPLQMNANTQWPGNPSARKLDFGACTGNLMDDLTANQLSDHARGSYNNFGKPALSVVTIGGNDLGFSTAINSCIVRAWGYPNIADCNDVLTEIERKVQDQDFFAKLDRTLLAIVAKGRLSGGAQPPESFQVFVNGYVPFWNEDDPGCDTVSWVWYRAATDHFLSRQVRKRMNDIVGQLNDALRQSADRLRNLGVIYVEGFQDSYKGHQFCDPAVDSHLDNPVNDNTWFWATNSPWDTSLASADSNDSTSLPEIIFRALVPDASQRAAVSSGQQYPSNFSDAFKSQAAFETALEGLGNSTDHTLSWILERYRRIFHPKGSAYKQQADANVKSILSARQGKVIAADPDPTSSAASMASSVGGPPPAPSQPSDICGDWYKLVLDYIEIRGSNFDPAKFGADGSGLESQIKGCGALTKWHFEYTPNDPRFSWYAHGQLPIGTKACVGRAVVSAGGEGPDGCTGSG